MGANPHANGGLLLRDLRMPDFRDYAVDVPAPGRIAAGIGDTRVLGPFPARCRSKLNEAQRNFRVFGPDEETVSNGPRGPLRGDRPPVGRRDACRATNFSRPPAA